MLITGGNGFLGSHLADRIVSMGIEVDIADVVSKVGCANIEHLKSKARIINCNILLDLHQMLSLLSDGYDVIFHMAAFSSPSLSEKNPDLAFKINVHGTYNVLRFAVETSCRKIVFPSAASLYGRYPKYLPIDEKHPVEIAGNTYNATKLAGEALCKAFEANHGLKCVIFRIFNTYGPRQSENFLIPSLIKQALMNGRIEVLNGSVKRDFIYVDDIIDAFISGAESDFTGGPINLGTGVETSVAELAGIIAELLSVEVTDLGKETFGSMRMFCDNSLAKQTLSWRPKIQLREGLTRTVNWHVEKWRNIRLK